MLLVQRTQWHLSAADDDSEEGSDGGGLWEARRAAQEEKPANRDLVSRAIALLARRDMSRAALIARLLKDGFERQECESVSRWCEACGFLDERRHAESLARRLGARYGTMRVSLGMRQKGVEDGAMSAALDGLRATEVDRARSLVMRRFPEDAAGPDVHARRYRFLRQRGFSGEVIHRALKAA
jgi:regulatory protein